MSSAPAVSQPSHQMQTLPHDIENNLQIILQTEDDDDWPDDIIKRLIKCIEDTPTLWNPNRLKEKNKAALEERQALWENIGACFCKTPEEIRKKWKSLLQTYRKQKQKYPQTTTSWKYDMMSFLDGVIVSADSIN